jgi:spermidine synthase
MSEVTKAGPTVLAGERDENGRERSVAAEAPTEGRRTSRLRSYNAEILLISFAALLLEISYTRVISFKLFYYYTYLVIGLALLGLGSGAVFVALSGRLKRATTDAILLWGMLLGAVSVALGWFVVSLTPIATLEIWDYWSPESYLNLGRLVVICLALFASFLAIGVMIATLFGREAERIGRLYFADLVGAGIACAVVVSFLGWWGPVSTIFLSGTVLALTGLSMVLRGRVKPSRKVPMAVASIVLAVLLGAVVVAPDALPRVREDDVKATLTDDNTMFSSWSPIFRVDAQDAGDVRLLYHDALLGSAIYRYNGDPSTLTRFDTDLRSLPFAVVGESPRNAMIIGAAGGHEILSSLYYDVGQIDAIELNPVTYDLVTDRFADYAGNIADDPRVNYVNGDGRSYLARSDEDYDVIWYPAPDSYAASNAATAGAFVLSESYLYTSDAIEDSLRHLSDDGIIAAQFGEVNFEAKPNRTTRYVSTARHALAELGIDDPSSHVMVATSPTDLGAAFVSTILIKRSPFTAEEVANFTDQLGNVEGGLLRYAPDSEGEYEPNPVSEVTTVSNADLDDWYDDYEYDVTPITDDGPFFWHFTNFRDVLANYGDEIDRNDLEDATGERVLLLLLGVAILFAAVFLLLPFLAIRQTWVQLPYKRRSALYFACLGLGFMFFEITLIQHLTLFLGYPTYSLTVTLASILIFTGVGALLSGRIKEQASRVLPWLFGALAVLTAFYLFALPPITESLLDWPLVARVLFAFVVLAPLGICLGMFMPLGIGAVASLTTHQNEYVAWGWAVNGFASVIGSVLTTILAMAFGFSTVLVIALVVYGLALLTLRGLVKPGLATAG